MKDVLYNINDSFHTKYSLNDAGREDIVVVNNNNNNISKVKNKHTTNIHR